MSLDGTLRVAVVGAGPAGFYACEELLKSSHPQVHVDLFDRLPTPYGLVRYGVAPDHPKIKNVTAIYDKIADLPRFRYFGNVEIGKHVTIDELRAHYHGVLLTVGAQADRRLGISGEDLAGSHPATEFVAWYNGHPDYRDCQFDLSCERVVVVGVGNVAIDVARILCSTPAELEKTDIADYALEALRHSKVREVVILGRRGPLQAAFTNPELKELDELEGADFRVVAEEIELDPHSQAAYEKEPDKAVAKRLEMLKAVSGHGERSKDRLLTLRFLVSPLEIHGANRVEAVRIGRNRITESLQAEATGVEETLPAGLVFRSVGYKGSALPGVPFDERKGTIPNQDGRVTQEGTVVPGLYAAGWIKRGPSGVIGTNKPCAKESALHLLADLAEGKLAAPSQGDIQTLLASREVRPVSYAEWKTLDALEKERGQALGRPRLKYTSVEDMISALEGASLSPA